MNAGFIAIAESYQQVKNCYYYFMPDTEEELPYHKQAVIDLAQDYNAEHFTSAIGEVRKVIAQVTAEDNTSDQQIARVRILRYLDLQLSHAPFAG